LFTSDQIADAYILALQKHRRNKGRPLRPLRDADYRVLNDLAKKVGDGWRDYQFISRDDSNKKVYHEWRSEFLDQIGKEQGWHRTTRNLYGSMLATLLNWRRKGVSKRTEKNLKVLRPGAELFLSLLNNHQPRLL